MLNCPPCCPHDRRTQAKLVKQEQPSLDAQYEKKLKGVETAQKMLVRDAQPWRFYALSTQPRQCAIQAHEQIPSKAPAPLRGEHPRSILHRARLPSRSRHPMTAQSSRRNPIVTTHVSRPRRRQGHPASRIPPALLTSPPGLPESLLLPAGLSRPLCPHSSSLDSPLPSQVLLWPMSRPQAFPHSPRPPEPPSIPHRPVDADN